MKAVKQTTFTYKPKKSAYIVCDSKAKLDSLKSFTRSGIKASIGNTYRLHDHLVNISKDEVKVHKEAYTNIVVFLKSEITELKQYISQQTQPIQAEPKRSTADDQINVVSQEFEA